MFPPEVLSTLAIALSVLMILMRTFDKNLSIREHEVFKEAVSRDIARVEARLIVAESLDKRIDILNRTYLAQKNPNGKG